MKISLQVTADMLLCIFCSLMALVIIGERFEGGDEAVKVTLISLVLLVSIAMGSGLYKMVVRFIGWRGCLRIALTLVIYFFGLLIAHLIFPETIKFLYVLINPVLLFFALLFWRSLARYTLGHEFSAQFFKHNVRPRVLVYGAGSAGRQLVNSLIIDGKTQVVGFVDGDVDLQGCNINGLVIYDPEDLSRLIEKFGVTDLYLAIPSLARHKRKMMLAELSKLPVAVRALPTLPEIVDGKVYVSDLRPVQIEEVLGREVVPPDVNLLSRDIQGKVVLVTGAGGSIGSEISRQALLQDPSVLVLFEQNEHALYVIERELAELRFNRDKPTKIVPVLGSVTNLNQMSAVFLKFGVQTVYHAAAYKHVPLVEQNPLTGLWNNVVGTKRIVAAAEKCGVDVLVLISTDKAVRPTNVMGCSKRIAELILQARQFVASSNGISTKFCMVRFGNVLGSSGSVIPAFKEQIRRGGPVTVTHPEIVRYFMTIPEAAQLVIQAGALGVGGDVMVLDMGSPVNIRDLAERMIHLSGLRIKSESDPGGDIEIVYTGLRSGEKLFEELLIGDNTSRTKHPKICLAREKMLPWDVLEPVLCGLEVAIKQGNSIEARRLVMKLVPEFAPQCENQDWLLN